MTTLETLAADVRAAETKLASALAAGMAPKPCAAKDHNQDECQRETVRVCAYCNEPVCILCTEPCLTCAADLHTDCREDHKREAKHAIDLPPATPSRPLTGNLIDALIAAVDARVR